MPQFDTWGDVKGKVKRDLDIEGEVFVRPDELLGYANEAIDEAEAEILTLQEEYFLSHTTFSTVSGTDEYDLPADIFGMKIRGMIFNQAGKIYPIKRMKDWRKFYNYEIDTQYQNSRHYQYLISNQVAGSPKILLSPTPNETGDVRVWYQRQANRMDGQDATIVDIPECLTFIIQFIKVRIYEKEGHPNFQGAVAILEQQRGLMRKKLSDAAPDGDNELEMDLSSYEDMN